MSETIKYLGLDLSLSSAGYAVIEVEDRTPRLVVASRIKTDAKKRHGQRLYTIATGLRDTLREYGEFKKIIRERGFSRFVATTQALFKVVGISDFIYRDYDIAEIPPTTIKKVIGGGGKASKQAVEDGVRIYLNLDIKYSFESDDASDACAVVLTYLIEEDLIDAI